MRRPSYPLPGVFTGQRTLNQLFDLIGAVVDGLRHQPAAGNNPVGSPVELRLAVTPGECLLRAASSSSNQAFHAFAAGRYRTQPRQVWGGCIAFMGNRSFADFSFAAKKGTIGEIKILVMPQVRRPVSFCLGLDPLAVWPAPRITPYCTPHLYAPKAN